jgi:DNA polymerase-3 subunit delta
VALTYPALRKDIEAGKLAPVYFLFGAETYFLDKLVALLEEKVLAGADRSFNLDVVYGNEINASQLVGLAKQYPTMAPRRLVVAKEAHRIRKDQFDTLAAYLEQPAPTTTLVLVWPDRKGPDARTRFGKAIARTVVFESKTLYDNQMPAWVEEQARAQDLEITPEAAHLMAEALGTNLGLVENEVAKLRLLMMGSGRRRVNRDDVLESVSIDKEFNVFELQTALGMRQYSRAQRIISYMAQNLKENPAVMVVSQLFGYYLKLGILLQENARTEAEAAKLLGLNPFVAKSYVACSRVHTLPLIRRNLALLLEADKALKGLTPTRMGDEHVLKTLVLQLGIN